MDTIHLIDTSIELPSLFTYPFCYEPHPLCQEAASAVQTYIDSQPMLKEDADQGKMFGVLVVEATDDNLRQSSCQTAFLAAYSGLLAGRNDWPWFVPPVFDAQEPNGYFKTHEAQISCINHRIDQLEEALSAMYQDDDYLRTKTIVAQLISQHEQKMKASKMLRDLRRMQHHIPPEENAMLVRESQFMKAEMRRIKKHCEVMESPWKEKEENLKHEISLLKQKRHADSDSLQRWLFSQYRLLNARGEEKDLLTVFKDYYPADSQLSSAIPPAGSGDCCAPKLLQYAYQHHLKPVCMAEFWWGRSPKAEVRHHFNYYPACRSKCLPILSWMMQGLDVESNPMDEPMAVAPIDELIVYEDDCLAVVNKPAGVLSVPGKIGRPSIEEMLRQHWHDDTTPMIVHRLDMETSGLMVVAKTKGTYVSLQKEFLEHRVEKTYVALLEGIPQGKAPEGVISLPLMPDISNRPCQMVDAVHGREAVTTYEMLGEEVGRMRIRLRPQTGRTHQLRVHCAHEQGLGMPILGDELYGHHDNRLFLHAETLTFVHPRTGERLRFVQPSAF